MPRPTTCAGPRPAIGGGDVVVPDALPAAPIARRHLATAVDVIAEDPDEHVSTVLRTMPRTSRPAPRTARAREVRSRPRNRGT